jgi:hypothetical protein
MILSARHNSIRGSIPEASPQRTEPEARDAGKRAATRLRLSMKPEVVPVHERPHERIMKALQPANERPPWLCLSMNA